ncbi:MAG: c-type cytochrome [Pseudomonadota bacterium]
MKQFFLLTLLFLSSSFASADPLSVKALAIIESSDCLACHSVDKKVVGPAFKDVAAKYKGNSKIVDTLVNKIKAGGSGNWGDIAMSPHPALSNSDLKVVVNWILAGAVK